MNNHCFLCMLNYLEIHQDKVSSMAWITTTKKSLGQKLNYIIKMCYEPNFDDTDYAEVLKHKRERKKGKRIKWRSDRKWTEIVQLLENPLSGTVEQDTSGL